MKKLEVCAFGLRLRISMARPQIPNGDLHSDAGRANTYAPKQHFRSRMTLHLYGNAPKTSRMEPINIRAAQNDLRPAQEMMHY